MTEKFKNLPFPVKFGLAILVPPLVLVFCACLDIFIMDRSCGATVPSSCELEGVVPVLLIFVAELPFALPLSRWLSSQGSAAQPWAWKLFYPGRHLLLTLVPALILWFIIGYFLGKIGNRFSTKTQKGCLFLLVASPIAGTLLLVIKLLLGTWANTLFFGV